MKHCTPHTRSGLIVVRSIKILAVAITVAAIACRSTTEPDPALCQQTYEFGNYGCSDVSGLAVTRAGVPASRAHVSIVSNQSIPGAWQIGAYTDTDSAGRFSVRVTSFGPLVDEKGQPSDSMALWVRIVLQSDINHPIIGDSVRVMARFAPVGGRAPSVVVPVVTLPLP